MKSIEAEFVMWPIPKKNVPQIDLKIGIGLMGVLVNWSSQRIVACSYEGLIETSVKINILNLIFYPVGG